MKKKGGRFYSVHIIEKSLRHHVIEWLATIFSVSAHLLNTGFLQIPGLDGYNASFFVYLVGNLLWISVGWKHKHWGVLATFGVFAIINVIKILILLGFI